MENRNHHKTSVVKWSRGDEIVVTGSRGGSGRMELYNIRNTSLEDESLCIFQGFMKQ
jgi:endonuclease YncB( thermonuclease family)